MLPPSTRHQKLGAMGCHGVSPTVNRPQVLRIKFILFDITMFMFFLGWDTYTCRYNKKNDLTFWCVFPFCESKNLSPTDHGHRSKPQVGLG
jgi:hypothetical protein